MVTLEERRLNIGDVPWPDLITPNKMDMPEPIIGTQDKIMPHLPAPAAPQPDIIPMTIPEIKSAATLYEERTASGPLFIRLDNFRTAMANCDHIAHLMRQRESMVSRINELKNMQDREFLALKTIIETSQRKLVFVERTILGERL